MIGDNRGPSIHFLIESSKRAGGSTPRIDDLVAELSKLPPEIVHSVLDDLPLRAILDVAQHHHHDGEVTEGEAYSGLPNDEARKQASYFDHCVLTHLRLQPVFPELSEFVRLSSIWSVYSTGIAELYERYPSLLKKATDPAQTPRKNIKHITDRLRGNARRIKKSNPSHCFDYLRHEFGQELFPIVPFDSLLDLFVKTLERYPVRSVRKARVPSSDTTATRVGKDMDALELQLARTSLNKSASTSQAVYPMPIREAIEIAILGLPYVYVPFRPLSLDISPKVPRTKYTPYSAKPYQSMSPNAQCFFTSPYHAHLKEIYADDKLEETLKDRMARPYDERELEWLEAFLKACDFMMKLE